ncbi:uncharacterized protein LOC131317521 [Rhododendron vialii]|uniref:uncharacterized protein LOC131317521 n=1 Tax=Rhododendron vialii TaxID=182163 RepID=UPI00265EBFF7|nr:uncharacterized protein LOC131317521 [Rhododendron vialii]
MQELVRDYHKDSGVARCALKLDLMKAYDSVSWGYLFEIMQIMGFPSLFIRWVHQCVTTAMYSIVINGGLVGYFPGKRGLRQGDPLSPYLFLLVMEGFSSLFQFRIGQGGFSYHPKCRELHLSHLMFADDLFIMCEADLSSFQLVRTMLNDFYSISGLQPNLHKSCAYFSGVSNENKYVLMPILAISEGRLPVKYLGVPLITARLRASDCQVLLDKIVSRIQSWNNKALSYGGRAQLIHSDLFSTGIQMKSSGAKVTWEAVCSPKDEGGLGFRVLKDWNKAAMTKHLWALALKADTLLVKWIHTYIIKDQCLWTIPIPASASWTVRKLFNLRPLVHPWITNVVGNGKNTFLWLDNWHPLGPLFARFGSRVVYNLGRHLHAKVDTIISDQSWQWPRGRNSMTRDIVRATPAHFVPHPSQEDRVIWNLTPNNKFSIKSTWNVVRRQHPQVNWCPIIWFKYHRTMNTTSFSALTLLKSLQKDLIPQCLVDGLPQIMDWMIQVDKGTQFSCLLLKVALAAPLYHVWGERNGRIFKGYGISGQQLETKVRTDIRACVSSWRNFQEFVPVNLFSWLDRGISHISKCLQRGLNNSSYTDCTGISRINKCLQRRLNNTDINNTVRIRQQIPILVIQLTEQVWMLGVEAYGLPEIRRALKWLQTTGGGRGESSEQLYMCECVCDGSGEQSNQALPMEEGEVGQLITFLPNGGASQWWSRREVDKVLL